MDTENGLTAVRREGFGGWVRRVKELSKEKEKLIGTDNSLVITIGRGSRRRG